MRLLPFLALLCACAARTPSVNPDAGTGGAGSPIYYAEGTRLQPLIFEMSDGTRAPYTGAFYDTVLRTNCAITASNGGWICVPLNQTFDAGLTPLVSGTVGP